MRAGATPIGSDGRCPGEDLVGDEVGGRGRFRRRFSGMDTRPPLRFKEEGTSILVLEALFLDYAPRLQTWRTSIVNPTSNIVLNVIVYPSTI